MSGKWLRGGVTGKFQRQDRVKQAGMTEDSWAWFLDGVEYRALYGTGIQVTQHLIFYESLLL